MKRLLLFLLITFLLNGCSPSDPVIDSLPEYESRVFYTSGGFQDYTDYAKYHYAYIDIADLEKAGLITIATTDDLTEINSYIDNFEGWVRMSEGELSNYDFDRSVISEGDCFYIYDKEGESIGSVTYEKFNYYNLYYFDLDANILYYFHSNI